MRIILPAKTQIAKTKTLTQTTVAPTGVENKIEAMMPVNAQKIPITPDDITTEKKLLNILSAERTGNTISADIRRDPTSCMLSTITTAMITDIRSL